MDDLGGVAFKRVRVVGAEVDAAALEVVAEGEGDAPGLGGHRGVFAQALLRSHQASYRRLSALRDWT